VGEVQHGRDNGLLLHATVVLVQRDPVDLDLVMNMTPCSPSANAE
jgi:hypothetical protein